MGYKKTIVCLANSRKLQGRCIAGLSLAENTLHEWIRPIGSSSKGELHAERFYANWREPQLLDVIEIALLQERPVTCHQEDHLTDANIKWLRKGSFPRERLKSEIATVEGCLWFDGGSTSNGQNDRIPADKAAMLTSSLILIQPEELVMRLQIEGPPFRKPRKRVRGDFSLAGFDYTLSVTDSFVEVQFQNAPEGTERTVTSPILCVSISEVFEEQNACYKLIAGVL